MTYLLAAGCSWTDANFVSEVDRAIDCSFPKWPELLAKQIGISEVQNVGQMGASNDYMFQHCYDKIIAKKPELVCILLTAWDRTTLFDYNINASADLIVYELNKKNRFSSDQLWLKQYYDKNKHMINATHDLWTDWWSVNNIVDKTLRNIFLFQCFCEQHNINYIIIQGVDPIQPPFGLIKPSSPAINDPRLQNIVYYIKRVLSSPYSNKIKEANILGWPFFWHAGGYTIYNRLLELDTVKFMVHQHDEHPGPLGHQFISNYFYRGYVDVYSKVS